MGALKCAGHSRTREFIFNVRFFHSFLSLQEAPFCPTTIIYSILFWRPSSGMNVASKFSKK